MPSSVNRRRIETAIAALVAVAAGIVGIATRESSTHLGPKFIAVDRIARLKDPVYLTQPPGPGSQLYIVQRQGTVRVLTSDRLLARPFLKISDLVRGGGGADGGMTSIAFPPDYARSGLFYVAYTDRQDRLQVARYSRSGEDPLVADRASGRVVLTVPEAKPQRHGGFITFGPDGYLYVGTGDGSAPGDPRGVAQSRSQLRGKILRINPAGPATPEIWAYGLGDPRRISFDRGSQTVGIADVGDQRYEEIEYLPVDKASGANFGWPAYDGFAVLRGGLTRKQATFPAIAFPRRRGCAVIGGYLVRDRRLSRIRGRELAGSYLYGVRCSGKLFAFRPHPGRRAGKLRSFRFRFRNLTSLATDKDGRIYVITEQGPYRHGKPTLGSVFRLVPNRKGH
jgi:glucose/arabinose dehydrogenase